MGFFVYCNRICCLNSVHVLRERHEPNTANALSQPNYEVLLLPELARPAAKLCGVEGIHNFVIQNTGANDEAERSFGYEKTWHFLR